MSSNEDLKRQILELQTAINSYKSNGNRPSQPALRYSSSGSNRQSYRYSPIRPPGLFQPRPRPPPSRNMKLIVKNGEADSTAQYIRCGNKLTKVDAVNNKPQPTCLPKQRKVVIDGELFISKGYGKKLVRVSANKPQPEQQEQIQKQQRVVSIEGVNYVRTKKGSLVRVEALRSLGKPRIKRGPAKKRVCTKYLFGRCNKSKECRYSHKPTPETVPVCLHFQRGMCTNVDCPFIHIKVNPNAPICRDFVYEGFCTKGAKCPHRHVWECPDWVEKGRCSKTKCQLPHPPLKTGDDYVEGDEQLLQRYAQRPVFGKQQDNTDDYSSGSEISDGNDDSDSLEQDLAEDEAEELLKWYDDNYLEPAQLEHQNTED